MSALPKPRYDTPESYLAMERASESRHEYYHGEIFAISGASRKHNLISLNLGTQLNLQLAEHLCEVYTNDMRVRVSPFHYTYPDVVAVCGNPLFEDTEVDTLLNPTIIFEVSSKSTVDYDKGQKFEAYRALDSLQEYLVVSQ